MLALERLDLAWEDHLTAALLEYVALTRSPQLRARSLELITENTGQDFGYDLNAWFSWAMLFPQDLVHLSHSRTRRSKPSRELGPCRRRGRSSLPTLWLHGFKRVNNFSPVSSLGSDL